MSMKDAPLTRYRIVDVVQRWHCPIPGEAKQPGGTCWHCGMGIANCVVIRHTDTGEQHEIGTTCAERVGLDAAQVRRMLADKFAAERAAAYAARREAIEQAAAASGPHGSETRYASGCRCRECREAAPHGTDDRFLAGCRCLDCIDAILAAMPHRYHVEKLVPVLVDLRTGAIADAREVSTQYGRRWCVDDGAVWLPIEPARRSTHAKRGFVEANAPYLVRGHDPIYALGEPLVDIWGERIPHPGHD